MEARKHKRYGYEELSIQIVKQLIEEAERKVEKGQVRKRGPGAGCWPNLQRLWFVGFFSIPVRGVSHWIVAAACAVASGGRNLTHAGEWSSRRHATCFYRPRTIAFSPEWSSGAI